MKRRIPRPRELAELVQFGPITLSATERRLSRAVTVDDLRSLARRRTPRAVFDYTDGGAGSEIAMRRARDALDSICFQPRVLRDVSTVDVSSTILGQPAAMPLILAPTGFTRLMHHEGELAVARAAARAGVPYVLSTMGTRSVAEVANAVPDGRRWFQLYLWRDREASAELITQAAEHGYDALMLTVDTPVGGQRLRDIRNGMSIPPAIRLRTVLNAARHPAWWFHFLTTEPLRFASLTSWDRPLAELATHMFDPTVTLDDVRWLRGVWPNRLVVKGIQRADDAVAVVDAGAEAVVVSSHGGRQLDRVAAPLDHLAAVVAGVGDRAQVYIDGGFRTGADVAAALALGADGVLVGRAYLYGLMAAGERGVDRALDIIRAELTNTMQLLGAAEIAHLTADMVMSDDGTEHKYADAH
ncbi:alpha-hydroxy acid oxidase [Mycolicibacterium thermoresistibile]